MESPRIVLLGDSASAAMRPVLEALQRLLPAADVRCAGSIEDAAQQFGSGDWHPDLVVVCQHWPDEFPFSEVDRLFRAFPLARSVVAYGAWCASDGRTRSIWPLAVRVPVSEVEDRLRRELEVVRGTRSPLPLTASRDEIFLFDTNAD
jgi:hypothetical protein